MHLVEADEPAHVGRDHGDRGRLVIRRAQRRAPHRAGLEIVDVEIGDEELGRARRHDTLEHRARRPRAGRYPRRDRPRTRWSAARRSSARACARRRTATLRARSRRWACTRRPGAGSRAERRRTPPWPARRPPVPLLPPGSAPEAAGACVAALIAERLAAASRRVQSASSASTRATWDTSLRQPTRLAQDDQTRVIEDHALGLEPLALLRRVLRVDDADVSAPSVVAPDHALPR